MGKRGRCSTIVLVEKPMLVLTGKPLTPLISLVMVFQIQKLIHIQSKYADIVKGK